LLLEPEEERIDEEDLPCLFLREELLDLRLLLPLLLR
jgi:hypothetical protein